jgi:diacylglycerol kinase family enzyme
MLCRKFSEKQGSRMRAYLDIAERVARILRYSHTVPGCTLTADIIINVRAGALAHRGRFKRVRRVFAEFTAGIEGAQRDAEALVVHYHFTQYHGHAREIARRILLANVDRDRQRVIVSLGGDGTHGEILSVLSSAAPSVQARTTVFRLPLGSGNDGADSPDLATALRVMLSGRTVSGIPSVRVETARGRSFHAFNIVSVGIDAFVTDVSARLKRLLPGNIYRIAAATSAALYQVLLHPREMTAEFRRADGAPVPRAGRFVLLAMGPSGHRTYGNGMRILPGDDNVCLVHRLSTVQIMTLKSSMYRGEHVDLPVVETFDSADITIRYDGRLPLQADGEPVWLEADDFPLRMSRGWSELKAPDVELSLGRVAIPAAAAQAKS